MLLEAWKEFEVFHLSYAHVPPIVSRSRAPKFPLPPSLFRLSTSVVLIQVYSVDL